jgi:hypothetical protein
MLASSREPWIIRRLLALIRATKKTYQSTSFLLVDDQGICLWQSFVGKKKKR